MDAVQRLTAIEDIRQIKALYCRFVDTKQWEALHDLFTPAATFDDRSGAMGPIADRDQFLAAVRAGLDGCVSVHHIHGSEITVTSPTTATAVWAMEDRLQWLPASPSAIRSLHGFGHYSESFGMIEGIWRITAWALTRLRVDVVQA